jgi:glycosyltransferase involved in cell wall biosynthesis
VQHRTSDEPSVIGPEGPRERLQAMLAPYIDRIPLKLRLARAGSMWSNEWFPNPVAERANRLDADLLNLHWVGGGFVPISLPARTRMPVVWTLHDMWPFTGGCHYDGECGHYRDRCGQCPVLSSTRQRDLSRVTWQRKSRAWGGAEFAVVAPSRWLAGCARESSLFCARRIEIIPNGLPLDRYRPLPKATARDLLGLPQDRRLIAFGAVASTGDPRKGYDLLVDALGRVAARSGAQAGLVVFGASAPADTREFDLPSWFLGHLHDDISLALVYSAADLFVAPSRQENLPNTVLEAAACGLPTVAFAIGGLPDIIEPGRTGYLAAPFDIDELAHGIQLLVESPELSTEWGARARARAETEFSLDTQAARYRALYEDLLSSRRADR